MSESEPVWEYVAPLSVERYYHGSESDGDYLYVFGGRTGDTSDPASSAQRYDPAADSWSDVASLNTPRSSTSSAFDGEYIYALGGYDGNNRLSSVERYDPAADSWTEVAPMNTVRYTHTSAFDGEYIYALGGYGANNRLSSVERYDPAADSWTEVAPMNTVRTGFTSAFDGEYIYALGGHDGRNRLSSVERYDPAADSWTEVAPLPTPRRLLSSAFDGKYIYVIGGLSASDTQIRYNPEEDSWAEIASLNDPRYQNASTHHGDYIYTSGGRSVTSVERIQTGESEPVIYGAVEETITASDGAAEAMPRAETETATVADDAPDLLVAAAQEAATVADLEPTRVFPALTETAATPTSEAWYNEGEVGFELISITDEKASKDTAAHFRLYDTEPFNVPELAETDLIRIKHPDYPTGSGYGEAAEEPETMATTTIDALESVGSTEVATVTESPATGYPAVGEIETATLVEDAPFMSGYVGVATTATARTSDTPTYTSPQNAEMETGGLYDPGDAFAAGYTSYTDDSTISVITEAAVPSGHTSLAETESLTATPVRPEAYSHVEFGHADTFVLIPGEGDNTPKLAESDALRAYDIPPPDVVSTINETITLSDVLEVDVQTGIALARLSLGATRSLKAVRTAEFGASEGTEF